MTRLGSHVQGLVNALAERTTKKKKEDEMHVSFSIHKDTLSNNFCFISQRRFSLKITPPSL